MYEVKQSRGRRAEVVAMPNRPRLVPDLAEDDDGLADLVANELTLAFQPEVSLVDGRMVAVEALARRLDPERGPLPLSRLGPIVLRSALREAMAWSADRPGRDPLPVAVNLSLAELALPGLVRSVELALREAGSEPGLLRLEVREAALVEDPGTVLRALRALHDAGVGTTIDDVGRALPALEAMGPLPADELKLDRPWVWAAARPWAPGHETLRAGARLAARLGLRSVAAAGEAEDELLAARDAGCDAATGYWFAAPQEAEIIRQLVRADVRWPT